MILNTGFNEVVEDTYDDISNGEAGDNGALFNKSQTGVISAIAATDIALSTKILANQRINMTYVLDTATANGETLAEYEVNNGTTAYNRVPKSDLAKTSSDEVTLIQSWDFVIVI